MSVNDKLAELLNFMMSNDGGGSFEELLSHFEQEGWTQWEVIHIFTKAVKDKLIDADIETMIVRSEDELLEFCIIPDGDICVICLGKEVAIGRYSDLFNLLGAIGYYPDMGGE